MITLAVELAGGESAEGRACQRAREIVRLEAPQQPEWAAYDFARAEFLPCDEAVYAESEAGWRAHAGTVSAAREYGVRGTFKYSLVFTPDGDALPLGMSQILPNDPPPFTGEGLLLILQAYEEDGLAEFQQRFLDAGGYR